MQARFAGRCLVSMLQGTWLLGLAALSLPACTTAHSEVQASDPEMAAYVELVLPTRIEIQRYLTRPVSFSGDGSADGLEVVLAAYDAAGDLTKVVGTFHFELQTRRLAERVGTRVAFWPLAVNSPEAMRMYRDPLSRFYQFPLELDQKPLPAGQYVLSVWLHLPAGRRLFDEYEFTYDGSGAPRVRPL